MKYSHLITTIAAFLIVCSVSCGRKTASGEIASGSDAKKTTQRLILNDSLPTHVDLTGNTRYVICKNPLQAVELEFSSESNHLLRAAISGIPDTANICFNSIVFPDGLSDTLTGKNIEYELTSAGTYRLVLEECLPENEPWGGDFTFDIDVVRRIPYVVGHNYYVLNNLRKGVFTEGVIDTREQFDTIFGRAAVMGSLPTEIDFDRQYVIAVVDNMSDDAVHLNVLSLVESEDGKLVMTYERERSGKRSYSVRPYLMIIVDRQYYGDVEIVAY